MTSFDPIKALDELTIRPGRELVVIPPKVLYRYHNSGDVIYLDTFRIIKETAKGVWINHWGKEKFVLAGDDGKRLGYRTKEAALNSFRKRKARQLRILNAQIQNVQLIQHITKGITPAELEKHSSFRSLTTQPFYACQEDFA
jgi:hypothetical protein